MLGDTCMQMHVGHMASHVSECMQIESCINGIHKWEMFGEGGEDIKERRRKKERERKERKRIKEKRERKKEKRKSTCSSNRSSNGRNSLYLCIFDEGYTIRGRDSSYFGLFRP